MIMIPQFKSFGIKLIVTSLFMRIPLIHGHFGLFKETPLQPGVIKRGAERDQARSPIAETGWKPILRSTPLLITPSFNLIEKFKFTLAQ